MIYLDALQAAIDTDENVPTVASDHPLQREWTYRVHFATKDRWCYANDNASLGTFDTICGFLSVFLHSPTPSTLSTHVVSITSKPVTTFSLFRSHIRPEWEDELNRVGGEWCIRDVSPHVADDIWRDLCLAVVGNVVECNGVRVTSKLHYASRAPMIKIEVWVASNDEAPNVLKRLQELDTPHAITECQWTYYRHDTVQHNGTTTSRRKRL